MKMNITKSIMEYLSFITWAIIFFKEGYKIFSIEKLFTSFVLNYLGLKCLDFKQKDLEGKE